MRLVHTYRHAPLSVGTVLVQVVQQQDRLNPTSKVRRNLPYVALLGLVRRPRRLGIALRRPHARVVADQQESVDHFGGQRRGAQHGARQVLPQQV